MSKRLIHRKNVRAALLLMGQQYAKSMDRVIPTRVSESAIDKIVDDIDCSMLDVVTSQSGKEKTIR